MASAAVQYAGKYLQFGYELQDRCKKLEHIEGAKKLERKIIAEIKFLKSVRFTKFHFIYIYIYIYI